MPTRKDTASQISGAVATLEPDEPRSKTAAHAPDAGAPARATVMLLRLLRAAQPISRAELARRVGVNRSTVTDTFKPLIAAGVVREEAVSAPAPGAGRSLGRPPAALSFSDEHGYFVGVNIGVRRTMVGLATLTGEVLGDEEFETPSEPSDALRVTREAAGRLIRRAGARRLRVIGVSVPGRPTRRGRR